MISILRRNDDNVQVLSRVLYRVFIKKPDFQNLILSF